MPMSGNEKLLADIKRVVEEVNQPMEQRLKDHFAKGLKDLGDEIKGVLRNGIAPRP